MSLRKIFGSKVSSSAFQVIDGESRIVGKFAQIALMDDGSFDIWIIKPGLEPLSTRKLHSIIKGFPQEASFTILTGEAFARVRDKGVILKRLSLLGIRKKRKLSPEAKEKLVLRLKAARAKLAPVSNVVDSNEYQEIMGHSSDTGQIQKQESIP